jgi:hypothetical protein
VAAPDGTIGFYSHDNGMRQIGGNLTGHSPRGSQEDLL